jgi:hypothetical protein
MCYVCTELDNFLEDKTIWIAKLSNNLLVYQDDDRYGRIPNAWIRLKEYIKKNNLSVIALAVRFRSHIVEIPPNSKGYYYAKSIFMNGSTSKDCIAIGYYNEDTNKFDVTDFAIPELEPLYNFSIDNTNNNPAILWNRQEKEL